MEHTILNKLWSNQFERIHPAESRIFSSERGFPLSPERGFCRDGCVTTSFGRHESLQVAGEERGESSVVGKIPVG